MRKRLILIKKRVHAILFPSATLCLYASILWIITKEQLAKNTNPCQVIDLELDIAVHVQLLFSKTKTRIFFKKAKVSCLALHISYSSLLSLTQHGFVFLDNYSFVIIHTEAQTHCSNYAFKYHLLHKLFSKYATFGTTIFCR